MTFNINEFTSNIAPKGLAKKSLYTVLITGPTSLSGTSNERDMTYRCDAITEPGRQISFTNDAYHYGLPMARAWGSSFEQMNMSFLCSHDQSEKIYFEKWQDLMIGAYRTGTSGANMFDIAYVNDYIGTVIIYKYDETGLNTYTMTLKNAFPLLVSDTELGWDDGSVEKLAVRMYFQYYTDTQGDTTAGTTTSGGSTSGGDTAGPALSQTS